MSRPNVLWIVSDHQPANRDVDPDLFPMQAFRERGTEFSRAYAVLPICSPSRALLTGLIRTPMV